MISSSQWYEPMCGNYWGIHIHTLSLLLLINEFSRVSGYKINMQSHCFFYILALGHPKIKIRKNQVVKISKFLCFKGHHQENKWGVWEMRRWWLGVQSPSHKINNIWASVAQCGDYDLQNHIINLEIFKRS